MESPEITKRKITEGDTAFPKVNCTPKNRRSCGITRDEFSLYNLHGESSPNFRAGQDVLEVGWGDSPEPLNVEQKFEPNRTSATCKKKLETNESPKSSIPFKRRTIQSAFKIPSKSIIDISKYVAEVQELSKTVMKEFNSNKNDPVEDAELISRNLTENSLVKRSRTSPIHSSSNDSSSKTSSNGGKNKDPMFDSVLQSFINEEDDWLSQALSSQEEVNTSHKGSFLKSKSENELTLPPPVNLDNKPRLSQNCKNINNNFRRTASFDLTKPHTNCDLNKMKDFNKNVSNNQYSLQEIERKRLEAKYRKERKEIERRKLEALKRLEMKKVRVIKTACL